MVERLLVWSGIRQGWSFLQVLFKIILEVLTRKINQEKVITKEEEKHILVSTSHDLYIKDSKDLIKNLLKITDKGTS